MALRDWKDSSKFPLPSKVADSYESLVSALGLNVYCTVSREHACQLQHETFTRALRNPFHVDALTNMLGEGEGVLRIFHPSNWVNYYTDESTRNRLDILIFVCAN